MSNVEVSKGDLAGVEKPKEEAESGPDLSHERFGMREVVIPLGGSEIRFNPLTSGFAIILLWGREYLVFLQLSYCNIGRLNHSQISLACSSDVPVDFQQFPFGVWWIPLSPGQSSSSTVAMLRKCSLGSMLELTRLSW